MSQKKKKKSQKLNKKRPKVSCEVCGLKDKRILHRHHIIPRQDPRSTNNDGNLAIVCPTCHSLIHAGDIIIIGVYQTTDGKRLAWFYEGDEPPFKKENWLVKDNPYIKVKAKNGS